LNKMRCKSKINIQNRFAFIFFFIILLKKISFL
jgi:hypothetical protein